MIPVSIGGIFYGFAVARAHVKRARAWELRKAASKFLPLVLFTESDMTGAFFEQRRSAFLRSWPSTVQRPSPQVRKVVPLENSPLHRLN